MRGVLASVALGVLLVASPAPVQGQATSFPSSLIVGPVTSPSAPLAIGVAEGVNVPWAYAFSSMASWSEAYASGEPVVIHFSPGPRCELAGVTFAGPVTIRVPVPMPAPDQQPVLSGVVPFNVTASSEAPGEMPIRCVASAVADAIGQTVPAVPTHQAAFTLTVAFDGRIAFNGTARAGEGDHVSIPVRNLGNSRTFVRIEVAEANGWDLAMGPDALLDSMAQGGTKTTGAVDVEVRGRGDASGVLLRLTPISTKDSTVVGAPMLYRLVPTGTACDEPCGAVLASPTPVAPIVVVALLGLAAALRRTCASPAPNRV